MLHAVPMIIHNPLLVCKTEFVLSSVLLGWTLRRYFWINLVLFQVSTDITSFIEEIF